MEHSNKISGCSAVGSALALGARCREFESPHSDQKSLETKWFQGISFLALQFMLQLAKMFYDKEKMEKNIEKTTIKIQ